MVVSQSLKSIKFFSAKDLQKAVCLHTVTENATNASRNVDLHHEKEGLRISLIQIFIHTMDTHVCFGL
jgi:hypothetical protein